MLFGCARTRVEREKEDRDAKQVSGANLGWYQEEGAFVFSSKDRKKWDASGPFFAGQEVHHVVQDPREPKRHYAAVGNAWFGSSSPRQRRSRQDLAAFREGPRMQRHRRQALGRFTEKGNELKEVADASLKRIWHIAPGAPDEPGVVYLGGDPGVLFRSGDNGANWEMVDGLNHHATRARWNPGAGGMMVHSIECLGKGRMIVGISAAGAFRSSDSGKTWGRLSTATFSVDFAPDKFPEVGQCVHKLKAHPRNPDALYQQNHCGIYRAGFDDAKWKDISKGLPSRFGFALAVPAAGTSDAVYRGYRIDSAEGERFVPGGRLRRAARVVATVAALWKLLSKGCLNPMRSCWFCGRP